MLSPPVSCCCRLLAYYDISVCRDSGGNSGGDSSGDSSGNSGSGG